MSIEPFFKNVYIPLAESKFNEEQYEYYKDLSEQFNREREYWKDNYFGLRNNLNNNYSNINSKEVLEAVRYAMIKSHPDNNGKQEDFIKFKKLYDSLQS